MANDKYMMAAFELWSVKYKRNRLGNSNIKRKYLTAIY